jgi:chemotaxis protein MotA
MAIPLILGVLGTLATIVGTTLMDGNSLGPLWGPSSLVLVLFTTILSGVTSLSMSEMATLPKSIVKAYVGSNPTKADTVNMVLALLNKYRADGKKIEALVTNGDVTDPAFVTGIQMVADGVDADQITLALTEYFDAVYERHATYIGAIQAMVGFAPTFGMVGTVIGLINMLGNLSDPSQLGAGMAVALLTTLYGVLIANVLFGPIFGKLSKLNDEEYALGELITLGFVAIREQANPTLLLPRLEARLPAAERIGSERMEQVAAVFANPAKPAADAVA